MTNVVEVHHIEWGWSANCLRFKHLNECLHTTPNDWSHSDMLQHSGVPCSQSPPFPSPESRKISLPLTAEGLGKPSFSPQPWDCAIVSPPTLSWWGKAVCQHRILDANGESAPPALARACSSGHSGWLQPYDHQAKPWQPELQLWLQWKRAQS